LKQGNEEKKKVFWRWPRFPPRNRAVGSALAGLTTGFEKGPGVAPPLKSPEDRRLLGTAASFE
jgi:hypothetical protein